MTLSLIHIYLSSGTWSLMGVETDAPVINTETETLNFTNEGGVEGKLPPADKDHYGMVNDPTVWMLLAKICLLYTSRLFESGSV